MAAVIAQTDDLAAEAVTARKRSPRPVSTYPPLDPLARPGFPTHAERQDTAARSGCGTGRPQSRPESDGIPRSPAMSSLSWSPSRCEEPPASVDDNAVLDDLFDSLGRIEFLSRVEERFGVALTDADWTRYRTLGDLRRFLLRDSRPQSASRPRKVGSHRRPGLGRRRTSTSIRGGLGRGRNRSFAWRFWN